jgi:membrane fusion protein (multidrug efflux system)
VKPRLSGLLIIVVLAVGILAAGYWWFSRGDQATSAEESTTAEGESSQEPIASIKVAPVKNGTVAEEITVYGTIIPAAGAVQTISVPFESRVRRIHVTEAQRVSQGDAVLEIEPSADTSLQTQQARNDYESAKKALDYTQQRFDLKLATNDQLLQAKQTLEQAQAKLESMRRRGSEEPRTIRADVAGLISKVAVQEGTIVPAGASMVEMVAQNRLEARLGIGPEFIDKIKIGQAVSLTRLNETGSEKVSGRIRKISDAADPTTRLVQVFIDIPSSSKFLLGEYIAGKITVASAQGLIVPRSAILPKEENYVLFTVNNNRAKEHMVRLGLQNSKDVEVLAGDLRSGDSVVILGNYELKDGMAVKAEEFR